MAASSAGIVSKPLTQVNVATIFDRLQAAGITWKNYVPDYPNGSSLKPFPAYSKYVGTNIVPMDEYFTDLQNGTFPQVVFIDRDSHQRARRTSRRRHQRARWRRLRQKHYRCFDEQ
jgi:phospholipase C